MTTPNAYHLALERVYARGTECTTCAYRIRDWNPDAKQYERGCDILEKSRDPANCPGLNDELNHERAA